MRRRHPGIARESIPFPGARDHVDRHRARQRHGRIAGATVTILRDITTTVAPEDWDRTATTDRSGAYRFENVTVGNANLSATAPGYEEQRAGQNLGVSNRVDFALRRNPAPEVFTGRVGWTEPADCIVQLPFDRGTADYPCVTFPFTMRRRGSIDVVVAWRGGTQNTMLVQVLGPPARSPLPLGTPARSTGRVHSLAFTQATFATGEHAVRIIDFDNARATGSPPQAPAKDVTLTLIRRD